MHNATHRSWGVLGLLWVSLGTSMKNINPEGSAGGVEVGPEEAEGGAADAEAEGCAGGVEAEGLGAETSPAATALEAEFWWSGEGCQFLVTVAVPEGCRVFWCSGRGCQLLVAVIVAVAVAVAVEVSFAAHGRRDNVAVPWLRIAEFTVKDAVRWLLDEQTVAAAVGGGRLVLFCVRQPQPSVSQVLQQHPLPDHGLQTRRLDMQPLQQPQLRTQPCLQHTLV